MTLDRMLLISRRPTPVSILYLGTIAIVVSAWLPTMIGLAVGEPLLDLVFFACSVSMLWQYGAKKGTLLALQSTWICYLLVSMVLAVWMRNVHPLDFAQAYKFVWYLILLAPFSWAQGPMRSTDFNRLFNISLFMFLSVYSFKRMMGDSRPILMTENNFEIIFLALLYFSVYTSGRRPSLAQTLTLLLIVVLSGSRSAALAVALAVIFAFDFKSRNSARILGGILAGLVGIALALVIFVRRSEGGIEAIDRFRFFLMFLESVRDWGTSDYLLGADRLTPLPSYVCSQLGYYTRLFSHDDNGQCYSVIFHSFNLRIIYDHGLIVAGIVIWYLMGLTKAASSSQRACVIGIVFISGLSVSALNNVYTALGIAIFCLAASAAKAPSLGSTTNSTVAARVGP